MQPEPHASLHGLTDFILPFLLKIFYTYPAIDCTRKTTLQSAGKPVYCNVVCLTLICLYFYFGRKSPALK